MKKQGIGNVHHQLLCVGRGCDTEYHNCMDYLWKDHQFLFFTEVISGLGDLLFTVCFCTTSLDKERGPWGHTEEVTWEKGALASELF